MNTYFVYILTNANRTVLYIWVTNDMERRLYEHRNKLLPWFTSAYNATELVYIESSSSIESAISREKQLKWWTRKKKENLIETTNPYWKNLASEWG